MKPIIRAAAGSTFLRHNIIYFIGSLGVSALNYLYYPVLGRLMQPADFGEVQTLISLFLQTSIFLQVLGLVSIGVIAKYQKLEDRNRIIAEYSRLAFFIALITLALTIMASSLLQGFFQFSSIWPFIAFGLVVVMSVPLAFSNSFLQAAQRFGDVSRSGIIGAGGKLILGALLVLIGLHAFGAIVAIALAQALALIYTLGKNPSGRPIIVSTLQFKKINFRAMRPELPFASLVLAASLTINVLLSLDIVVIKHYFDPHTAGLYAGIATIARIIFYVTGPMAMVLVATIKPDNPQFNRQLLLRSCGLSLLTGGTCLAVFTLAPHQVIGFMLGQTYLRYAYLLPSLSLAIFTLAAGNLLVYYYVAARQYLAAIIAPICLTLGLFLIITHHDTLQTVITQLTITGTVLTCSLALGLLKQRRVGV